MDDEVGVAPDGTCEMTVRRRREAVVSQVLGTVQRTAHRAQEQRGDHLPFGTTRGKFDRAPDGLRVPAHDPRRKPIVAPAELAKHDGDLAEGVGRGPLVDAVRARPVRPRQKRGDGLVGEYHRLLDQLGGIVLPPQDDLHRIALLVEAHLSLGHREVDSAGLRPSRGAHLGEGRARAQVTAKPLAIDVRRQNDVRTSPLVVGEGQIERVVVRQAHVRSDERGIDVEIEQTSLVVEEQIDRQRAPRLAGNERAQVVAQLVREHGYHPVDEVHARRAPASLEVD